MSKLRTRGPRTPSNEIIFVIQPHIEQIARVGSMELYQSPGSDMLANISTSPIDSNRLHLSSLAIVTMLVPFVIYVCDCYVCMKAREGEREKPPALPSRTGGFCWVAARQPGRRTGEQPRSGRGLIRGLIRFIFNLGPVPRTSLNIPRLSWENLARLRRNSQSEFNGTTTLA